MTNRSSGQDGRERRADYVIARRVGALLVVSGTRCPLNGRRCGQPWFAVDPLARRDNAVCGMKWAYNQIEELGIRSSFDIGCCVVATGVCFFV